MASIVERLTENIVERNLLREGAALSKKWERTGLLEGIDSEMTKTTMSRLLENQAKELLREASTMSAGDVEGFAAVAFPIVRRVFGGLIANELVAVQPMSLPSGLIFFLDFNYSDAAGLNDDLRLGGRKDKSVYGGDKLASEITSGVNPYTTSVLDGGSTGFYGLANAYASSTGSVDAANEAGLGIQTLKMAAGGTLVSALTDTEKGYFDWDPDILAVSTQKVQVIECDYSDLTDFDTSLAVTLELQNNATQYVGFDDSAGATANTRTTTYHVRRLTKAISATRIRLVFVDTAGSSIDWSGTPFETGDNKDQFGVGTYPKKDVVTNAGSLKPGAVTELSGLPFEAVTAIPEIDIKVDSIAITATTKKLKAKWSPELGQDLNAYHNLDAEVELTSILSEHVALEIDQEILNDLVKGATAGTKYWSRRPGKFVDRDTGASITSVGAPPDFTGNVSMWYETLIETINDVSAQIHRKTLRGGANFLVTSPEVANILEFTSGFRADVSMEDLKGGSVGAVKAGSLSKKWDLYVDPYFPRNLILVGRRGKAFLESGYVYAPYVPLMITPTIFGTEDFVPRKGLMTRYAKKMVRPDMFGLVIVQDLIG
jgi:hypothetical protein